MKVQASAACLALLAVTVPLARANVEEIADYADVPATDADPTEIADYADAEEPALVVSADTPGPVDAMAPVPADMPAADMPTADEPATAPMDVDEMWEECLTKLGTNATHSLADLVTGPFETRNEGPSVFLPLLEKADPETLALLEDFDLSGEGYTLILPYNTARDFNSSAPQATGDVFEVYDFDPNTTTTAEVTEVLQAHVIPGTLTFNAILAALEDNGTYTVESLQGYEWTFALASAGGLIDATANATAAANATDGEGGTYPVLVDNHNLTTTGFFNIEADIRIVAECPNAIIASTDGFFAAPQYLAEPAEAPVPAPAPALAPEPIAEEPTTEEPEGPPDTETGAPPPPDGEDDTGAAAGAVGGLAATAAAGVGALVLALL